MKSFHPILLVFLLIISKPLKKKIYFKLIKESLNIKMTKF